MKWEIVRLSSSAYSFNGSCTLCIDEKISIINFKDHRQLLNESTELRFKYRRISKFKSTWLGATEVPTQDKNKDIYFG